MVGVPLGPSPRSLRNALPCGVAHTSFPFARSNAITNSRSPRSPIVYRRPFAIENDEYPRPAPAAFHTSAGPCAGHSFNSPVSFEIPSRFGPRHWGQSALLCAGTGAANTNNNVTVANTTHLLFMTRALLRVLETSTGETRK